MNRRRTLPSVALLDVLLNSLLCLIVFFLIIEDNPAKKKVKLTTEGVFAIVMTWPDESADDVDLHVRDPGGRTAYFRSREVGLMHLERDDLGASNDSYRGDEGEYEVARNEERVILRGVVPGEYVVNAHMYRKSDAGPTPVAVRLVRMKGDEEVTKRELTLSANGDLLTAFRFSLAEGEIVANVNTLPDDNERRFPGSTEGED